MDFKWMIRIAVFAVLLLGVACMRDQRVDSAQSPSRAIVVGSVRGAMTGVVSVKLTPAAARAVTADQVAQRSRAAGSSESLRSGIDSLDRILNEVGAGNFARTFEYDPTYEALYAQTGVDRWYEVTFGEDRSLEVVGSRLAALGAVAVVEYAPDPACRRPMAVGRAVPLEQTARPEATTRAAGAMNDPLLVEQWHYDNAGLSTAYPTRVAGADINLLDAWALCAGDQRVLVAVIDQAVQSTHPDLAANIWSNPDNSREHGYNFLNQRPELDWITPSGDVYPDHGTHVAGVIAAVSGNGRGVCGVAGGRNGGGVRIISCQILGNDTSNKDSSCDSKALIYAMKSGALIAQNSWGYSKLYTEYQWDHDARFSKLQDAINTFVLGAGMNDPSSPLKGGLVIFSAGNDGVDYGDAKVWPAACDNVISVGAMGWDFKPAYYTDYGPWVEISAPGGDQLLSFPQGGILSTITCDDANHYTDGRQTNPTTYGYGYMQGTSMAAPHVTGVAALGLAYAAQLGRQYTAKEFKSLLLSSVYGIDSYFVGTKEGVNAKRQLCTLPLSRYIGGMGGGCVDALKLLLAIRGTSALYVQTNQPTTIDFASYFGGAGSRIELLSVDMASADLERMGLKTLPSFSGSQLTLDCPKIGAALISLRARVGDTIISREFAIVSRPSLAGNGGWL